MMQLKISIVLLHYEKDEFTNHVIQKLYDQCSHLSIEVIVVDDASSHPFTPKRSWEMLTVIRQKTNQGFAAGCNLGALHSRGQYLLFLNNDIDFYSDFMTPLVQILDEHINVGLVGPEVFYQDGAYQLSFGNFPTLKEEFFEKITQAQAQKRVGDLYEKRKRQSSQIRTVNWLSGVCLLIRKNVFEEINGFDSQYRFYFEDVDLSMRVWKAGYEVVFNPHSKITHFLGGTFKTKPHAVLESYRMGQCRFYSKYNSLFQFLILKIYLFFKFGFNALKDLKHISFWISLKWKVFKFPFRIK